MKIPWDLWKDPVVFIFEIVCHFERNPSADGWSREIFFIISDFSIPDHSILDNERYNNFID